MGQIHVRACARVCQDPWRGPSTNSLQGKSRIHSEASAAKTNSFDKVNQTTDKQNTGTSRFAVDRQFVYVGINQIHATYIAMYEKHKKLLYVFQSQ